MAEHPLDEVARQFSRFSASDRLAKLGGLQLIPENSRRALRLELAACAAASTAEGGEFTATAEEIRTILNRSAVSDPQLVMLEDPTGGWFVESVTFVGGAYLVFPGITTDATFTLDLLGRALALYRRPYSSGGFAPSAVRLLQAALLVSDEVAKRAGLGRGVLATGAAESSDIVVPEDSRLAALAEAVRFTGAELNDILRPCEADSSILDPLMIECGQLDLSSCDTQTYALQSTPIVQVDSEYIVAAPSLLTPAARHQVVCMAKKHQVVDELAARVNLAAWNTAVKCFRYMRITLSAPRFPGPRPSLLMADGLFGFDTDKALYAAVISDDLTDYDEETVFGAAPEQRVWPALKAHLDRVFWSLAKSDNPPNAVLCVVLSSGLGRAWGFGVGDRGASPPYKLMAMTVSDLTVIAHLEGGHSLFLWKFCSAGDRLRERCEVFAAGSLSEYGCYRDRDYSFYLSDREIPNMLTLASDWDGPLRTEYLDKVDPHGVPSHDGRHISGVVALHGTRSVPIYTEEATLGERVALLVEGYAIPIWVVGPESYEAGDAATHPALVQLADMIAYWLWQYEPSMRDWFAKTFARTRQVLVISIDADESLEVRTSDLDSLASGEPFHIQTPEGSAAVQVTFHAAVAGLLDGPENAGEKQIMTAILRGLRDAAGSEEVPDLPNEQIDGIVETHSSPSTKKKMVIVHSETSPELDPRGLGTARFVQRSDEAELLDGLGEWLREDKNVAVGPIPKDRRVEILSGSVDYYYKQLVSLVATLSPRGLLEWLVRHHEALLHETARGKLTLPTRLACFETEESLRTEWTRERSDLAKAAVALRTVIEYVVARPPRGVRPMSLSVHDRLVALASEIVQVGFQSDVVHFGLSDPKLSMLPSGRLGRDFAAYEAASRQFAGSYTAADISAAAARFADHWTVPTQARPEEAAEIEDASRVEFGHSLQEIGTHWAAAAAIAQDASPGACRIERSMLISQLTRSLAWSRSKVSELIDSFSLGPRSDFLKPPPPFEPGDVYPWRFTRHYSYLRRPLLLVCAGSGTDVLLGPRHLHRAWRYLLHICLGGRLQATSPEMRRLISRFNQETSDAFNDQVADAVEQERGWVVRRRVKKAGRLRGRNGPPGDIDVLAANAEGRRLLLVECKDLALARTPREMAQQLEDLFIGRSNKKSAVEKHLARARWARRHLRDLLLWLGFDRSGDWRVEPLVVLDHRPMSALLTQSPVPVLPLSELIESLRT